MAWAVVSRVLAAVCGALIAGEVLWYVDDSLLITEVQNLDADDAVVENKSKELLGDNAFAEGKYIRGVSRVDNFIGWTLDCEHMWVSIGERLLLRMVYVFSTVDFSERQTLKLVQKVAAWVSRIGIVCRAPKALSGVLHGEVSRGVQEGHTMITLSAEAQAVVAVWRAYVTLAALEPDDQCSHRRSLYSFLPPASPTVQISFDGCPSGCGVVLREYSPDRGEGRVLAVCGIKFPFSCCHLEGPKAGTYDSAFQNSTEFLGIVVGLALLARAGARGVTLRLTGDSRVALRWGESGRFKGRLARRAALAFTFLSSKYGLTVEEEVWRSKDDNTTEDLLSREYSTEARARALSELGVAGQTQLLVLYEDEPALGRLLSLCDPTAPFPTQGDELFALMRAFGSL